MDPCKILNRSSYVHLPSVESAMKLQPTSYDDEISSEISFDFFGIESVQIEFNKGKSFVLRNYTKFDRYNKKVKLKLVFKKTLHT